MLASALLIVFVLPQLSRSDHADACEHCRRLERHACAGWPQCIAPWAKPSFGCHEWGCYVGGGAAFYGDCRCSHEGTWGWDYHGCLFPKRIWLGWHHGRRNQGGTGAYATDGPKLLSHE